MYGIRISTLVRCKNCHRIELFFQDDNSPLDFIDCLHHKFFYMEEQKKGKITYFETDDEGR